MEEVFLVYLILLSAAMLILLIIVLTKLSRLENALRAIGKPTPPPAAPAPQRPAVMPPQASFPPPPPKPTAAPQTHFPPPPLPQKPSGESLFTGFLRWFCIGNRREGESVEYAAATTWLMRAGVLILLFGVGFFLKYSIENDLVSPPVRITMTYLAGLAMFGAGLYGLYKRFHVLAVGILAAGVVTLYMGSFAGYRLYKLVPVEAAFALMVLTTAAGMLVAVRRNLLPVALTGCVGAYLTPVLLADKPGSLPFFLGYIALVSCGVLLAAREHRWRSLECAAFALSFILTACALDGAPRQVDWWCVAFLLVDFLVFSLIPVIRKPNFPFGLIEWLLPVGAAGFTLLLGVDMISKIKPAWQDFAQAGFALLIAAVTLAEGTWLARRRADGEKLLPAFLAASMVCLAIAVPLAHESAGSMATGWAALGFALAFAHTRSRRKTLLVLSVLVFIAAVLAGLAIPAPADITERFFRHGVCAFALLGAGLLLVKRGANETARTVGKVGLVFGGLLFLYWSSVEVHRGLKACEALAGFRNGGVTVWWAVLAVSMLAFGIVRRVKAMRIAALCLFGVCAFKIVFVDLAKLDTLQKAIAFLLVAVLFLGGAAGYIFCRKRFSGERS